MERDFLLRHHIQNHDYCDNYQNRKRNTPSGYWIITADLTGLTVYNKLISLTFIVKTRQPDRQHQILVCDIRIRCTSVKVPDMIRIVAASDIALY